MLTNSKTLKRKNTVKEQKKWRRVAPEEEISVKVFILIEQMLADYDDGGSGDLSVFAKQMSVHPCSLRDIVACAFSDLDAIWTSSGNAHIRNCEWPRERCCDDDWDWTCWRNPVRTGDKGISSVAASTVESALISSADFRVHRSCSSTKAKLMMIGASADAVEQVKPHDED